MKNENEKNDAKQDLLIIDAETGLLSLPSTLECVSPNSGILFPNLFGASSERINLYNIGQSNTTIINILFFGLGRHVSIPLESSSSLSTKIYRSFT